MPFFSKVFKNKDGPGVPAKARKHAEPANGGLAVPPKPRWEDAWSRKEVAPEEIHELIRICTQEMKSRALDMPFLLLPFRPHSDTSSARTFIRNFFKSIYEGSAQYSDQGLQHEMRLTEPMVLCSIMKWCWSRLPGGIVTWDVYELFKIGEQDSNMARHAFDTFIPLSVDSEARKQIIFDFFDLLAAIAARGKTNGLGGRKLSRMAGWWAFEHVDSGEGFDRGYRSWASAADATSHLFFAYLRSLSPGSVTGLSGINTLPRSLEALVAQTEYPPETPLLMQTKTPKVVMIVDSVSPTPFALLRRAKHFEYRDDDEVLQRFSAFEDPVDALTDECRRVLNCISSTNQSSISAGGPVGSQSNGAWSRFEDMGFGGLEDGITNSNGNSHGPHRKAPSGLRSEGTSRTTGQGRPTTPSWADFLSAGFNEDHTGNPPAPLLLPPDKVLPPIGPVRVQSSQSHVRSDNLGDDLEPGELASITQFNLDETFWWVWMTSLAGEETTQRKAVFGRCALIETAILGSKWLVMEEQVKGASPGPEEGAYIAEKKSRFSFTRRGRRGGRKSANKKIVQEPLHRDRSDTPTSKTSIGPDQHAKIQAAAARLKQKDEVLNQDAQRRGRMDDQVSMKTNSVFTLQPFLMSEAAQAMKWASEFDKDNIRAKYLGDSTAGRGKSKEDLLASSTNLPATNGSVTPTLPRELSNRDLPALPTSEADSEPTRREVLSPSPPSLPITPTISAPPNNDLAREAAKVPIPSLTPLDEKPISPPDLSDMHPAYRQGVTESKPVASLGSSPAAEVARRVLAAPLSSPEAGPVNESANRTKKVGSGGGGLKKLFGRKKGESSEHSDRSGTPQVSKTNSNLNVPRPTVGRRTSRLRKKEPAPSPPPPYQPSPIMEEDNNVSAMPTHVGPEPTVDDLMVATGYHEDSLPSASRLTTTEEHEADQSFSRFDQGPLEDVPAFVPDDMPEDSPKEETVPAPQFKTRAAALLYQQAQPHNPPSPEAVPITRESTNDDESEASVDLTCQVSPVQDRWAQIRKNAAERAAKMSEEQNSSRRSHSQSARTEQTDRTDDGETSGEETIESRVARIKARVAELTGNMDAQGNIRTGSARY